MKKRFYLPVVICCLLFSLTVPCNAAVVGGEIAASVMVPVTSDVTSVVALTLAGVAGIGGLLLRKKK